MEQTDKIQAWILISSRGGTEGKNHEAIVSCEYLGPAEYTVQLHDNSPPSILIHLFPYMLSIWQWIGELRFRVEEVNNGANVRSLSVLTCSVHFRRQRNLTDNQCRPAGNECTGATILDSDAVPQKWSERKSGTQQWPRPEICWTPCGAAWGPNPIAPILRAHRCIFSHCNKQNNWVD